MAWNTKSSSVQPYYDKLASNLLFIGFFISCIIIGFSRPGLLDSPFYKSNNSFAVIVYSISTLLLLFQYYCIRRGKMWAKVLLVVFFLSGLLLLVLDFKGALANGLNTPLKVANYILGDLLQAAAIFLAFRYKFNKEGDEHEKTLTS
jgi:hypothetical protein